MSPPVKTAVATADNDEQRKILLTRIVTLLKSPLYWISRAGR